MLDFLYVSVCPGKGGVLEVKPKFICRASVKDVMIRGGDFYAVWDNEAGLWSTKEDDVSRMVDKELDDYVEKHNLANVKVLHMWDSDSGSIDRWHKYCQKQMRDNYHNLNEKLIFADTVVKRSDYASKKLPYSIEECQTPNYTKLSTTLYSPDELHKIEWAIGAILTGDARKIQKFEVLYGSAGTGKGTMLEIISKLFQGYNCSFEAKSLGSANASFPLEPFKNNPLVAIDYDGNLSRIEDNTRLNALVSHEEMQVNTKFGKLFPNKFKCFIFMGTNNPVKITDAKSGLMRRLIDVYPSGNKIPIKEYTKLMGGIEFELGGIAHHCREVYLEDPNYYDGYVPINMMGESNDFYNFVEDSANMFSGQDCVTLKQAWSMYKEYCENAKVPYPYSMRAFKTELKNYFDIFEERRTMDDGSRVYSCYSGFKFDFNKPRVKAKKNEEPTSWLKFEKRDSILDLVAKDWPAQYANASGTPSRKWENTTTVLADLDTSRLHYLKCPTEYIIVDFDKKDASGKKSFELNYEAASKWPPTYAELSKSGAGIHLEYIYTGDTSKLKNLYEEDVEIKVFNGNSSLRRQLTLCNNLPIAKISSGLPLKGDEDVINFTGIINEKGIRTSIKKNLAKDIHPGTKPSIDFIKKILDDAYEQNVKYDVSDMRTAVVAFAAGSTHHAQECLRTVSQMKFKSKEVLDDDIVDVRDIPIEPKDPTWIFYDIEDFPNLFLINHQRLTKEYFDKVMEEIRSVNEPNAKLRERKINKIIRKAIENNPEPIVRMINPTPQEVEELMNHNLIGFNCRRYDNHILYARMMGYSEEELFRLSQRLVNAKKDNREAFFKEAFDISYTDIYDYSSEKQSLKKWEIAMRLKHLELNLPWDKPVPKEMWPTVSEYCDNDVKSTIGVWFKTQADFLAREILADLAGGSVNDTTNTLTTKLIFGNNRKPQLNYRFLGDKPEGKSFTYEDVFEYAVGHTDKKPEGTVWFPGYKFDPTKSNDEKSTYRGYLVGEGGRVYANPGSYGESETWDVGSMHPHSIKEERAFGDYTDSFVELLDARMHIKHKDFESAGKLFEGRLTKYLTDPTMAKNLAQALKIAINSVYGLTSAKFINAFRDERNIDNLVAKRGALFMIDLQLAVESLGYKVIHIKTDSIKVHHPDDFIRTFIKKFGECYGYSFELEAAWDRICLVNNAVFIGHTEDGWEATGAEFQQPYVFKTLFTHEDLEFEDYCETKSVKEGAIYLDMGDDSEMRFIGRVGQFTPVKHGGHLWRVNDGKNHAVTGTKDYLWLESDMVKTLGKEDDIDISYYEDMAHKAMGHIIAHGNYADFVDLSKPYVYEVPESGEVPFDSPADPVQDSKYLAPLELPFK